MSQQLSKYGSGYHDTGRTMSSQIARLAYAGNAEVAAALATERPCNLERAVSVGVGLDHRHQFRAATGRFDRPVVGAQRSQVDLGHGRRPVSDFHRRLKPSFLCSLLVMSPR